MHKSLIAAAAALALLSDSPAFAGGATVPFYGSYEGSLVLTWLPPSERGMEASMTFTGVGISTYMGKGPDNGVAALHFDGTICPGGVPGGVPHEHQETLTAANGDTLTILANDVACPTDSEGLHYHGSGIWHVIGGTGRFAGVTGQGVGNGYSDFTTMTYHFVLDGTITAPGN
jgi:hypothetical protein